MGRWLVVMVLAACGSRGSDSPPPPPPVPVTNDAPAPPIPAPPVFEVLPPADKLVAVGRGDRHACVVRESGAVDCWGQHRRPCKDCRREVPPDASVRRVTGIDDAVGVAANAQCFLRRGGEVACLDENKLTVVPLAGVADARIGAPKAQCFIDGKGGLTCIDGDGKPWKVPNVTDAIAVDSSEYTTCIVRKSGTVACGSINDHAPFVTVQGIDRVTEIVMVGRLEGHACAVTRGRVRCFLLEYPDPKRPLKAQFEHEGISMDLRDPEPFVGATQLAMWIPPEDSHRFRLEGVVGGKIVGTTDYLDANVIPVLTDAAIHTRGCAIRAQGSLVCWEHNDGGVLAQPTTLGSFDVPATPVVGLSGVVDIATGLSKSFAVTADGRVWWWGNTENYPRRKGNPVPTELQRGTGQDKVVQIVATTKNHACMHSSNGDVWCQTYTSEGRVEKLAVGPAREIASLGYDVLLHRHDGTVEAHRITVESEIDSARGMEKIPAPDVVQFTDIGPHGCSSRRDGTVHCPDRVKELTAATAVVAGRDHGCAVQRGRVWCWFGTYERKMSPATEVPGLGDVTELASSADHACAVHDGGRVSCWRYKKKEWSWLPPQQVIAGGAVDVELGHATSDQFEDSFRIDGAAPAGQYGCARMADRTVRCWGANLMGELGDGSFVGATSPIGIKL